MFGGTNSIVHDWKVECSAERYCIATNSWTPLQPMPRNVVNGIATVVTYKQCSSHSSSSGSSSSSHGTRTVIMILSGTRDGSVDEEDLIYDPQRNTYEWIDIGAPVSAFTRRTSATLDHTNGSVMVMVPHVPTPDEPAYYHRVQLPIIATWILPASALIDALLAPPVSMNGYPLVLYRGGASVVEASSSSSRSSSSWGGNHKGVVHSGGMTRKVATHQWYRLGNLPGETSAIACMTP